MHPLAPFLLLVLAAPAAADLGGSRQGGHASPAGAWPRSVFSDDPAHLATAERRARERGHALLVLVLPDDRAARRERIDRWCEVLDAAGERTLAELASLELVGASEALLSRGLRPAAGHRPGSIAALLSEPGCDSPSVLSAAALELDPLAGLLARDESVRSVLRRSQVERSLLELVAGTPETLECRARAERGPLSPDELSRLTLARGRGQVPPADLVARFPARIRLEALELPQEPARSWIEALARWTTGRAGAGLRCGLERFLPPCPGG